MWDKDAAERLAQEIKMSNQALRLVPVVMGVHTYYVVLDRDGYPVAQGSEETCRRAMEAARG